MLRGEVWWVAFDPSLGGEMQKTRPAVIVSNDYTIEISIGFRSCRLQVTLREFIQPRRVFSLTANREKSDGRPDCDRRAKMRVKSKLGSVSDADLRAIERALRIQLGLED